MSYQWTDYDRSAINQRYDRLANLIPVVDQVLFVPHDLRRKAVDRLELKPGQTVVDVGCGTGTSFFFLHDAVGPAGRIHGIDISCGMLRKARDLCDAHRWRNIELSQCDAVDFVAPAPLDGALFCLTYNTIPHHRLVLRRLWDQLRPGGRLVIMDAKLPSGAMGKFLLPFSLWLMRHTLLGNPLIRPWEEIAELAGQIEMSEFLFGAYYICRATKPLVTNQPRDLVRKSQLCSNRSKREMASRRARCRQGRDLKRNAPRVRDDLSRKVVRTNGNRLLPGVTGRKASAGGIGG